MLAGGQRRTITTKCGREYSGNPQTTNKLAEMHTRKCDICSTYEKMPAFDFKNAGNNGYRGINSKGLADTRVAHAYHETKFVSEVVIKK